MDDTFYRTYFALVYLYCIHVHLNTELTTELPPLALCGGEDLGVVSHPVVNVGPQGVHPHQ